VRAFRRLTFELRRDRRQGARPGPVKMYSVPPARGWWLAVGPRLERGVRPRAPAPRPGKSVPSPGELRIQRHTLQASVSCCTSRRLGPATRRQTSCERDRPAQTRRSRAAQAGDQLRHRHHRYPVSYSTFRANRRRSRGSSIASTSSLGSRAFYSPGCERRYWRPCGLQAGTRRARATCAFLPVWLFNPRRQTLILLACSGAPVARPNVRVEAGPTARRQARAGDNVPVPPARAWWLAVGPRLERGVRPQRAGLSATVCIEMGRETRLS